MDEQEAFPSESKPRVIPRWAAALIEQLSRENPAALSRNDLARILKDVGSNVDVETAVKGLLRLGWLRSVSLRGSFAFIPPGVDELADPYIALRAWRVREPRAKFCLAGDNAAWHLGYLPREPQRVMLWTPAKTQLPKGLRGKVGNVQTKFPSKLDVAALGPTHEVLRKRRLDLLQWASGLPAFGPEALLVQLASRPASFSAWLDFSGKLQELAGDINIEKLEALLAASTGSARQRAAYLLHVGGAPMHAMRVLPKKLAIVALGTEGPAKWDRVTQVNDHIVARFIDANAKG